eukprot:scaffold7_cov414-Pavlova_lutheri.AAC.8
MQDHVARASGWYTKGLGLIFFLLFYCLECTGPKRDGLLQHRFEHLSRYINGASHVTLPYNLRGFADSLTSILCNLSRGQQSA